MVRPSYVLGGRAMEKVHDEEELVEYIARAVSISPERPILVDRFLENAIEAEADAVSDGRDAFVPAVMEHIELAGVHSGDSACVLPPVNIPAEHLATVEEYTRRIAVEFGVVGLMNVQYAIAGGKVYILEANPRASRTVPLVSKVCRIPMARMAARVMLGEPLSAVGAERRRVPYFGVKEAVFPFNMFPEVDPVLGPEMRSTGEVLGLAACHGEAFFKAQEAAGQSLPLAGTVLVTVADPDKEGAATAAREFAAQGFAILATEGTCRFLAGRGVEAKAVKKIQDGRPNLVDAIKNGEVHLVVNTPVGKESVYEDSYIRKAAIKYKVPYITTTAAAIAAARGIASVRSGRSALLSLQEYHATIG
jgi:carbamoyl-phosphate synthase large subunit